MKYYIDVNTVLNLKQITEKYKVGSILNISHNWPIEVGSIIFNYFNFKEKSGIYAVSKVIESFAIEKDMAISRIEVIRCDDYPLVKKNEMNPDKTRFYYLQGISQEDADEYYKMMDRWEPYAESHLLSIEQIAYQINSSIQTINYWYAFKRRNPDNKYAKMLPDFYQLNKRQKRYWPKESIKDLLIFKNSIPKGRNGVLGDVTQKYIHNREINGEAKYIHETIDNLRKRNVSDIAIENIRKLLLNDARQRGINI